MLDALTPDEKLYLKQAPPGMVFPLSEADLIKRLDMAQRMAARFLEIDGTLPPDMKAVYEEYPLWGFYQGVDGKGIYQHWGVGQRRDGRYVLQVVSCHILSSNLILGGIPVGELKRIERWSPAQLSIIETNPDAGMYVDPLGFLFALQRYYD